MSRLKPFTTLLILVNAARFPFGTARNRIGEWDKRNNGLLFRIKERGKWNDREEKGPGKPVFGPLPPFFSQ